MYWKINYLKMWSGLIGLMLLAVSSIASDIMQKTRSATELMTEVDQRYRGDTWKIDSYVLLIDKDNSRNERILRVLGKKYGKDEKTLTYILEPARIKGTGILSYDWDDSNIENESWLYLPDLGKTTRLTTSNRSDYFLGTDFTYGDLEGIEVEEFEYEYKGKEKKGEIELIAKPKSKSIVDKYGYEKIHYWVDVEKNVINKAQYILKDKGWTKYYRQFEFKQIDGVWISNREQMVMVKQGKKIHSTIITRGEININVAIDDSLFTVSGLERVSE